MKNPIYKMIKKIAHSHNWNVSWWQKGGSITINDKVIKVKDWMRIKVSTGGNK